MIAEIAIDVPLPSTYDYIVPNNLLNKVAPGTRVVVNFANREVVGYCVNIKTDTTYTGRLKEIIEVLDDIPLINPITLRWALWISKYYGCGPGEILQLLFPPQLRKKRKINISYKDFVDIVPEKIIKKSLDLELTEEQKKSEERIKELLDKERFGVVLLHGVTGSGKTQIYLDAIEYVIRKKKQAIVLVPEIALTPQTIDRFEERFSDIAVLHSNLLGSIRFSYWKKIFTRQAVVIIGARSAIFAPTSQLGLIVIDEEHETSYKQEDTPRYHARDIAIKRAHMENALVIMGTATPSMESYYNYIKKRKYIYLQLSHRIKGMREPYIKIVDMRYQKSSKSLISDVLRIEIERTLARKEQVILFLNRRGYSPYVYCPRCGYVYKCPYCSISLTYHKDLDMLICHYCQHSTKASSICPECEFNGVLFFGAGTQKIEEQIQNLFPEYTISRFDSDTTTKRDSHYKILSEFRERKIDILIGTQMLAKGHDFPNVTLVGVLLADLTLTIPDFRASERTFNLLTQVIGRAGRSSKDSVAIIQTFMPDHYAIKYACKQDYNGFALKELSEREINLYPPFSRIIRIIVRGKNEEKVKNKIEDIFEYLHTKKTDDIQILGPAPCPISMIKEFYRYHILLKSTKLESLHRLLAIIRTESIFLSRSTLHISIDVDPISLL